MSTDTKFAETVRNLLNMKPKPHDEATDKEKGRAYPGLSSGAESTSSSKE